MTSLEFSRQLWTIFRRWWDDCVQLQGAPRTGVLLAREILAFLRDSTPERQRLRYGDMDYDWEYRVNTTGGTVGWRERLLGVFLSAYQPTEPAAFHEMMASLPVDFRKFSFVDLGSGKGRTLLMASEYPFRRIIGVEILPELHRAAEENIRAYQKRPVETPLAASPPQRGIAGQAETQPTAFLGENLVRIESVCVDAREYQFPEDPLVVYLFNPMAETGLIRVIGNLERSLAGNPRAVYVLYHNPLLEHVLARSPVWKKVGGTNQSTIFTNAG